jgi:large subunit ribosomal protein L13
MQTLYPKKECHVPKWFIIDADQKTLGRLATEVSKLLIGKEISFYTPGVDQGNFVVILNANKISISGKKETQKLYYRNSQRPGSLKIETFKQLKQRIPTRIIEKAVKGMLPKGVLGRNYYRRLFVYCTNTLNSNEQNSLIDSTKWIKVNF